MNDDGRRDHFLSTLAASGNCTAFELQSVLAAARLDPAAPAPVLATVLLVMRAAASGDSCIYVRDWAESLVIGDLKMPAAVAWISLLRQSPLLGEGDAFCPLILDAAAGRISLQRHRKNEKELATLLKQRARGLVAVDKEGLAETLDRLFTPAADGEPDWQRVAAGTALAKRLCVITGGPGTGKTHTVANILLALNSVSAPQVLRMALAAPTGKAAARLKDAVREHLDRGPAGAAALTPPEATTLHRLLGLMPGRGAGAGNRFSILPYDVVVVDEVSMADLALMRRLVASLSPACRLVLLGDRNQLASVEPGRVFGDLCSGVRGNRFSPALTAALTAQGLRSALTIAAVGPLEDSIVVLEKSYRFSKESGIGRLAAAILHEPADVVLGLLAGSLNDIRCQRHEEGQEELQRGIFSASAPVVQAGTPEEAFAAFDRFRILCVHRHGAWGLLAVCGLVRRLLERQGLVPLGALWYHGRPVMVTKNSYSMRLFNGDIGIAMQDGDGQTGVWFRRPEGGFRRVSPARLPEHEDAHALTVHKSQGSEFDEVLLFLPTQPSPLLSRELFYTALTRARRKFILRGEAQFLAQGLARTASRRSALAELLWQHGD